MNMKIGFDILFRVPTVLLAFIYCYLGTSNYWQLFLFLSMILIMYLPGMLLLHLVYTYHIKYRVQREFGDFGMNKE